MMEDSASVCSRRAPYGQQYKGKYPAPSIRQLVDRKRKRERRILRRKTLNSGWKANVLNILGLFVALSLFAAHFTHLQADADYKIYQPEALVPPLVNRELIPRVVENGHWIALGAFLLHLGSMWIATTRVTFASLLGLVVWPLLAFLHFERNHGPDYLLCRTPASAFAVVVYAMIVFLPKKLKHRKRPNTLSSAFSVASTPESQQTQLSSRFGGLTRMNTGDTNEDDARTTLSSLNNEEDDDRCSVASFRTNRTNYSAATGFSDLSSAPRPKTLFTSSSSTNKNPFNTSFNNSDNNRRPNKGWKFGASIGEKETFDDAIAELDTLNGNAAQKQKNAGGKQPTSQRIQKKHGKPTSIFFHPPLRTKISNLLNDKLTLEYSTEEENSSSSDGEKERTRNFQHQQWNNKFKNGGGTPKSQQKPSSPFHLSTTPKKNISAAPKSHSHSPWRKNTDHSDW